MGTIEQRAGLAGRHAAVVGGGFGIGRAITLALAESGVELAICDDDGEALPETIAAAEAAGVSVFGQCFDALDPALLMAFYEEAGKRLGHLDIVVNVVGGAHMGFLFEETGPEDWADDIQRNFGYMLHSTSAALPLIRKSGRGGSIINFTTIEAHRGAATLSVYAGAKAATANFSRSLANELAHEQIRVNTVAPDMTPSRGNNRAAQKKGFAGMGDIAPEKLARTVEIGCPMGVAPSPDDLANTVLFLASDLSAAITGNVLHADGGTWASSGFLRWQGTYFSPLPPPDFSLAD
jgi:NAD(P)-dependent dehydrogenase (short-subunit alcohol dehydrogenase family)